jgi:hypothetical protein
MRARNRIVSVVLMTALAGLAIAWWASRTPAPENVQPGEDVEGRPATEPGLAPRPVEVGRAPTPGTLPTGAPSTPATSPTIEPTTPRRIRIRRADGQETRGATVTLIGAGRAFAVPVGPDGIVDIPGEVERLGLDKMSAHVEIPGGPSVVVHGLGAPDLVVTIPEGHEFAGRVVGGATGAGLPDLPLVVSSRPARLYAVFPEDVDASAWALARPDATQPPTWTRARTDREGRFRVRVASNAQVTVVIDPTREEDRAWFILQPEAPAGYRPVEYVALPAATVEGTVTDAGTGDRLPAAGVTIRLGRTERGAELSFGMQAPGGSFRATCARTGSPGSELPGSVSASAEAYLPQEVPFVLAATERTARADLRLQPLAAAGGTVETTVEILDEDGDPSDLPWFLEVATPTEERRRLSLATLVRSAPGRYTAAVPPGEWTLRVLLPQHFADLYAASEVVRVEPERPATLRFRVPRGGPVVLRSAALADGPVREALQVETPREGTPWWRGESIPKQRSEIRFHALAEAPREIRFSYVGGRHGTAVAVRPTKGSEVAVDVPAP